MSELQQNLPPRGRFAPSPTGRMHLGNVFCALLAWLCAKKEGGKFVLRIEDLDTSRCRREYADKIMSDLEFLGLEWDEGPFYQSSRGELYQEALDRLSGTSLTYPCWCTRADISTASAPHQSDGRRVYPGTCRDNPSRAALFAGKPFSTRLKVPDTEIVFNDLHYGMQRVNLKDECGDFVIRRSDGQWAYQFAVVVDDALMGITRVVRGRDLLSSAAQQQYLFGLLGGDCPEYAHIPLICSENGARLCKRDASLDMEHLRRRFGARRIIGILGYAAGLLESVQDCTAQDLVPLFDWNKIPQKDIVINKFQLEE